MLIIRSIISFIVGLAAVLGLKYFFGIEATSFSIFFVIPVGAMIAGIIMGWGYGAGLLGANIKSSTLTKRLRLLLAIVFFVAIQFGYYQLTYVNDNYEYNFQFEGDHISEFYFEDTGEQVNFVNFTIDKINTETISFSYRGRTELGAVEGNSTVNWIFFAIDFLGFWLGIVIAYGMKLDNVIFCDDCKKYMKNKTILRITDSYDEKIAQFKEWVTMMNTAELSAFVSAHPKDATPIQDVYLDGELHHCNDCQSGHMKFRVYQKNSKGKYSEESSKSETVSLNRSVTSVLGAE